MLDRSNALQAAVQRFENVLRADPQRQERLAQEAQQKKRSRQEDPRQVKQRQAFVNGSAFLAKELDALALQVSAFTRDSQRRSLYEDSGVTLAQSSDAIKRKMDGILKGIHGLKSIVEDSATRQLKQHYAIILDTLQKRFRTVGKTFQDCLEARTKALSTRQAEQTRQFGAARVQLSTPQPSVYNPAQARVPQQRDYNGPGSPGLGSPGQAPGPSAGMSSPMNSSPLTSAGIRRRGAPPPPAPSSYMQQEATNPYAPHMMSPSGQDEPLQPGSHFGQRQVAQYDRTAIMQRQRAMEMRNVEAMLTEASQVFGRMATLVAEQGEVVDRIDEQIDMASVHVEAGQNELLKYYNNLSKERAFILKIFVTVILLASFFMYWWR